MLACLRRAGGVIGAVAAVLLPAACYGGHRSAPSVPSPPPLSLAVPGPGTGWGGLVDQVKSGTSVTTAMSVNAFSLAVAPLPGSTVGPGLAGAVADGTVGPDWIIRQWAAMAPDDRQAVVADLVPPARATLTAFSEASPPPAQPYLSAAEHARAQIAGQMGRNTVQDIRVVMTPEVRARSSALAYTVSFDRSWGFAGPAAHCVIYVNPLLYRQDDTALTESVMDHEVFHCFQADDFTTVEAFAAAPDWLIQGSAEWVGDSLDPQPDPWWGPYLTEVGTPLPQRTFDAVGFFAHMAESGTDPWKYLDSMLSSGSTLGAYAYGASDQFRATWASSLADQPFGEGWQTGGAGSVPSPYHPGISVIENGSSVSRTVAAYANAVVPIDVAADVVDVTVTNSLARLHAADGSELDGSLLSDVQFCVTTTCSNCPNLASLSRLPSGPAWLAVTGDDAGATYSVKGSQAVCAACPVGSWTTTAYSVTLPDGSADARTLSGGSGISITIQPGGTMSIDYTDMQPVTAGGPSSGQETGVFSGRQTSTLTMTSLTEKSGSFLPPTKTVPLDLGAGSAAGEQPGNPFASPAPVAWSCSGASMTFDAPGSHWTLSRRP